MGSGLFLWMKNGSGCDLRGDDGGRSFLVGYGLRSIGGEECDRLLVGYGVRSLKSIIIKLDLN